jgi:hypothetical protein
MRNPWLVVCAFLAVLMFYFMVSDIGAKFEIIRLRKQVERCAR